MRGQLHPFEPVRLDIVGKHAARCVDRDEQIEPLAFHLLKRVTPAWLGERDESKSESEHLQTESQETARTIHRGGKLRQQARRNELLQTLRAALFRAEEERNQHRDHKQSPKPFWRAESHTSDDY